MYGIIPKQSKQTAATHWVCWQINFTYRTPTHPLARGPGLSFRMEMEKRAVLAMECRLPSANLRKTINFRPASNIKGENLFESFQRFLPPKTHTQTPTQTREAAAGSGPINAVKCKSFCIFRMSVRCLYKVHGIPAGWAAYRIRGRSMMMASTDHPANATKYSASSL